MQIFVIGMHRSGTSMVTRIVNLMGTYFGAEGMATDTQIGPENPKGFWERKDVRKLNQMLLHRMRWDWDRVSGFNVSQIGPDLLNDFENQAKMILLQMDAHRPWVIKDPRCCLTFSLWRPLLEVPVIVWVHRNPLEIARSLQTRNGLSLDFGLALWEKYTLEALKATRGCPIVFVAHKDLMQRPLETTSKLYQDLTALGFGSLRQPSASEIESFIEKKYYRAKATPNSLSAHLNQPQLALLTAIESKKVFTEEALPLTLSEGGQEALLHYETTLQTKELLDHARQNLANHQKSLQEIRTRNAHLEKQLDENQLLVREKQKLLKKWRRRQKRQEVDHAQNLEITRQLRRQHNGLKKQHRKLLAELTQIHQSKLWKLGLLVHRVRSFFKTEPKSLQAASSQKKSPAYIEVAGHDEPSLSGNATVDIVICIHNALDDVRRCIKSVASHTDIKRHRLILVDDGSAEETATLTKEFAQTLQTVHLRNDLARGYTIAANQGLRAAKGELVVLLNSDTIVGPRWLNHLMATASLPNTACVGPLSNAASWQSIPDLTDETGTWKVNDVPAGLSIENFARALESGATPLNPTTPFVNGFCFAITRRALDTVGLLDEETYPRGYGEEDDFAIRCLQAGLVNRISDGCYVFHAKSKSFTPEGRKKLVVESKKKIKQKHSRSLMSELVTQIKESEALLRARLSACLAPIRVELRQTSQLVIPKQQLSIAWPQPHLKTVGGIRRVIEMTNRLHHMGHEVVVYTPDGTKPTWLPMACQVLPFTQLGARSFDVVLLSDPDNLNACNQIKASLKVIYHLAYYEAYRQKDDKLTEFYNQKNVLNITNSKWVAEQIADHYEVAGVFPGGIDHDTFQPKSNPGEYDVVCYGSKRPHKGTDTIIEATQGYRLLKLADLKAPQEMLATHISNGRVFASACWHEGFNFCPLEAMACGVPVVMTDDGGSREYARHGENALVVPPRDVEAFRAAVERALMDKHLRSQFIKQGMETAIHYNWNQVTNRFSEFLIKQHQKV